MRRLPRKGDIWVVKFHKRSKAKLRESSRYTSYMTIAVITDTDHNICILCNLIQKLIYPSCNLCFQEVPFRIVAISLFFPHYKWINKGYGKLWLAYKISGLTFFPLHYSTPMFDNVQIPSLMWLKKADVQETRGKIDIEAFVEVNKGKAILDKIVNEPRLLPHFVNLILKIA